MDILDSVLNYPILRTNGQDSPIRSQWREHKLLTAFQPIFSLAHQRPVGYEALVRAQHKTLGAISPIQLFGNVDQEEIMQLDRACRLAHVGNFKSLAPDNAWLFLNVNPSVVLQGMQGNTHFLGDLLEFFQVPPNRVVVEILEKAIEDEHLLVEAVAYFRSMGCLVALDDFGAGQSNFDRVWRLEPDIVKLDRNMIHNAVTNPRARSVLPGLVQLLHTAGCLVLLEGIETEAEAMIALDTEADFVQGFHFARPQTDQAQILQKQCSDLSQLSNRFRSHASDQTRQMWQRITPQLEQFANMIHRYQNGPRREAFDELLVDNNVLRCFILDDDGIQQGPNLESQAEVREAFERFGPVSDASLADWSRKAYYRRASCNEGQVQLSGPYLSITDGRMCLTLSQSVIREGKRQIICCDVAWDSSAPLMTASISPSGTGTRMAG
ncbi:EAL domain-containing protein [Magnetococcus sp. PR-3]|uniref:EAL domain-containing protein n=1 Tax=Magnetococcus sp. PR-3 TaxID=3120355 RepID=UPI002FCE458F